MRYKRHNPQYFAVSFPAPEKGRIKLAKWISQNTTNHVRGQGWYSPKDQELVFFYKSPSSRMDAILAVADAYKIQGRVRSDLVPMERVRAQAPSVTPRQAQDAAEKLGYLRTAEIVGPGGLSGASMAALVRLVREAGQHRNPARRAPAWVASALKGGATVHEGGEHGFWSVVQGQRWLSDADTPRGKLSYGDNFDEEPNDIGEMPAAKALAWLAGKLNPRKNPAPVHDFVKNLLDAKQYKAEKSSNRDGSWRIFGPQGALSKVLWSKSEAQAYLKSAEFSDYLASLGVYHAMVPLKGETVTVELLSGERVQIPLKTPGDVSLIAGLARRQGYYKVRRDVDDRWARKKAGLPPLTAGQYAGLTFRANPRELTKKAFAKQYKALLDDVLALRARAKEGVFQSSDWAALTVRARDIYFAVLEAGLDADDPRIMVQFSKENAEKAYREYLHQETARLESVAAQKEQDKWDRYYGRKNPRSRR